MKSPDVIFRVSKTRHGITDMERKGLPSLPSPSGLPYHVAPAEDQSDEKLNKLELEHKPKLGRVERNKQAIKVLEVVSRKRKGAMATVC